MTTDNTLAEVREALAKFLAQTKMSGINVWNVSGMIDAEKALAKLDALIEAQGWQPIETAPKDGSVLLLYQPINKSIHDPPIAQYFEYSVCRWENGVWRIENEYCGDISTINAPTHWKPLPKPPSNGEMNYGQ